MWFRLSIAAATTLMIGGVGARAAELPTYEVVGFPITPHQLVVLGPPNAQEWAPALTPTLAGMPASPHQIAVLMPRQRPTEQIASSGERMGMTRDAKVMPAMWLLESEANKLGRPKINGTDTVAGKQVPAIYFGSTKMNNNFDLIDEVVKEAQGTATIFVKNSDEYVSVATNVKKDDGTRAVGTVLDPKGKAIESIKKDEPFYGEVDILGKPFITGYKPIRDASKNVIGIYSAGYMK